MKVFAPGYYREFKCIAAKCPDSCCKEWAVDVDPAAAAFYRGLPGALGDDLRAVLRDEDGGTVMTITEGRCPMWRQDGLCRIQAELGHDALCKTCREFPRLRHDYGDFCELGLELSCPEAARLILSGGHDWVVQEVPGSEEPDYDREVMDILLHSRAVALDFLSSGAYPLPQALGILLLYGHSVQGWIDGGEAIDLDPEVCLAAARRYAGAADPDGLLKFFQGLEILTPHWKARLEQPMACRAWDPRLAGLARYCIQRYWLQAVADYDLVSRVKFAVIACLVVNLLGGDIVETAQLFSKEIENDPDNLEAILDGCYASPALTDANLLGCALNF